MDKQHFLKYEFTKHLQSIPADMKPIFGKMSLHQMIEHMGHSFRQASGLIPQKPVNTDEITAKMYSFMMSDRPFKENTPNPYMPDIPTPPVYESVEKALVNLQKEIDVFFTTFENNTEKRILNPFFGNLNFDEWVHLLHKHCLHHLRQFGISL